MGKFEPYLNNETEIIAREIMSQGKGAWSAFIRQACRDWKAENMSIQEINQAIKDKEKLKKQLEKEEAELISKKKQIEKTNQIETLSNKKQVELLEKVRNETGVEGEFLEKIKTMKKPNMQTLRELMRVNKVPATKILKAWDMIHEPNKEENKLLEVVA